MAHTPLPVDGVLIDQVILGKYQIKSILGQGGMGVVAECIHLQLNQRLAIKMLRQDVLLDQDAVERFKREAQAAAQIKSEYVAHVSDVGTLDDGTPYMVMEYLEGHDLGALLVERGSLMVPWTCELMLQTAEALAEAHSLGIVHRDIKPTNLFVTWRPDGTALIKVLDFGISKTTMGTDMHLTQTQSLLGTPAYMSPEQMRSARLVDARTDIWSLGSVMYELLEGRKPFEADSFSEMCVKVAVDEPAPMTRTPPELQDIVLRCLAKSPDQRYGSMAEFAHELVPFVQDPHQASLMVERMHRVLRRSLGDWDADSARSVPSHVRDVASSPVRVPRRAATEPTGVPAGVTSREPSVPARAPSELGTTRRRGRLGWVLGAITLLGVAGGAAALALRGGGDPPATAAVEPDPAGSAVVASPPDPGRPQPDPAPVPTNVVAGDGSGSATTTPGTGSGSGSATETAAEPTDGDLTVPPTPKPDPRAAERARKARLAAQKAAAQKAAAKKLAAELAAKQAAKDAAIKKPGPGGKCADGSSPYAHPHGCPK